MNSLRILLVFSFLFSMFGCTTAQISPDPCAPEAEMREPSSVMCQSLFENKSASNTKLRQIVEVKNKIKSHLNIVSELLPSSISESFWTTVVQLGNNDSRIQLSSSEMVLTKNYDSNLKIHSTYVYDNASNSFLISKLEYSTSTTKKQLISDEPIDPETNKLKPDLFVSLESATPSNKKITIVDHIDYKVYEKINKEMPHLELLTTYELSKLNKLSPSARTLKYNALTRARSLRKFFTDNILTNYLYTPVKFIFVSIVSVYIVSHVDFVQNVVSKSNVTPNWVAPSVVKMAVAYPESVQPELVSLIKRIEYQEKSEQPDADKVQKMSQDNNDLVKIDEADQFSIEVEKNTKKTYFFVSHQKESGTIDMYATEINPAQYPNLIAYFKKTSHK